MFAYFCAASVTVIPILIFGLATSNAIRAPNLSEAVSAYLFFTPIAAAYALPVALPTILLAEVRKIDHWAIFASVGALLGVLLVAAFTELPFHGINIGFAATLFTASLCGAITYWLVALRIFSFYGTPTLQAEPTA